MTEAEWLACEDPTPLMASLQRNASDRKLRLFAVACRRRIEPILARDRPDRYEDGRQAVLTSERYADGRATGEELREAYYAAEFCLGGDGYQPFRDVACHDRSDLVDMPMKTLDELLGSEFLRLRDPTDPDHLPLEARKVIEAVERQEMAIQVLFLRDIFGNPFRRRPKIKKAWRTDTAMSLARTTYEARDFSAMPILADALQDAGCDSDDVLNHCRRDGPHIRGCWVVDLVLGKE
jgi:hypothetical protein